MALKTGSDIGQMTMTLLPVTCNHTSKPELIVLDGDKTGMLSFLAHPVAISKTHVKYLSSIHASDYHWMAHVL